MCSDTMWVRFRGLANFTSVYRIDMSTTVRRRVLAYPLVARAGGGEVEYVHTLRAMVIAAHYAIAGTLHVGTFPRKAPRRYFC